MAAGVTGSYYGDGSLQIGLGAMFLALGFAVKPPKLSRVDKTVLNIVSGGYELKESVKESQDDKSDVVEVERTTPCVNVNDRRLKRRIRRKLAASKKPSRIPVLAGEVAGELKLRHNVLRDTVSNRKLINADTTRRILALRKDGNPKFENLRTKDIQLVALHAAKMYWIPTDDEIEVQEIYQSTMLMNLRKVRSVWAEPDSA